jgi:hypothetical protein
MSAVFTVGDNAALEVCPSGPAQPVTASKESIIGSLRRVTQITYRAWSQCDDPFCTTQSFLSWRSRQGRKREADPVPTQMEHSRRQSLDVKC